MVNKNPKSGSTLKLYLRRISSKKMNRGRIDKKSKNKVKFKTEILETYLLKRC